MSPPDLPADAWTIVTSDPVGHLHFWVPVGLVVAFMTNRLFIGQRWPTLTETLLLIVGIIGLIQPLRTFVDAALQPSDNATVMQVVGSVCVIALISKDVVTVIRDLIIRRTHFDVPSLPQSGGPVGDTGPKAASSAKAGNVKHRGKAAR